MDEFEAQTRTNLFGLVAMSKVFLSYFRQRRSGCIVNMSSQGSDIPWRGISAYSASKGATNAFTDTLKEEVSSFGIRVMCVQPGLFGTRVGANLARPAHEIKDVPEYAEIAESHANYAINAGKEPGDPKKGADRIVQVMQEMEVPSRLVLGDDAYDVLTKIYKGRLDELEKYKELSTGLNFDSHNHEQMF